MGKMTQKTIWLVRNRLKSMGRVDRISRLHRVGLSPCLQLLGLRRQRRIQSVHLRLQRCRLRLRRVGAGNGGGNGSVGGNGGGGGGCQVGDGGGGGGGSSGGGGGGVVGRAARALALV